MNSSIGKITVTVNENTFFCLILHADCLEIEVAFRQIHVLVYRDCDLSDAAVLALHVKSERGGSVEAFVDGVSMGSFTGDTRTCEFRSAPKLDRYAEEEVKERNRYREPVYEDVEISLADRPQTDGVSEIRLVLKGDMRICYLRVLKNKSTGKIQMGVAN